MKVRWLCFYQVDVERGECGAEFTTEVDELDWKMGEASAVCPRCGVTLTQDLDDPEAIDEDRTLLQRRIQGNQRDR
jgi:hypothetical protein